MLLFIAPALLICFHMLSAVPLAIAGQQIRGIFPSRAVEVVNADSKAAGVRPQLSQLPATVPFEPPILLTFGTLSSGPRTDRQGGY